MTTKRIAPIDGLRGIAILMVMLHHSFDPVYGYGRALDGIFATLSLGWAGVDLFFVISGFLITGILLETRQTSHYFLNFYARRLLRIFPLYYLFCFLALYIMPHLPWAEPLSFTAIETNQAWLWLYGANILIAIKHSWLLVTNCLELNHLWSLAVEEHFYLIWPLIVWLCSSKQLKTICLATVSIVFAARVYYVFTSHDYISAYILTPFRIDALLLGSLCAILRLELPAAKFKQIGQISLAAAFILLAASFRFFDWRLSGTFAPAFGLTLLPILFTAAIICVVTASEASLSARLFASKSLAFFGKYSYALYIYHFPILKMLSAMGMTVYLIEATHSQLAGTMLYNLTAFALAVVTAVLSWHIWEKHFLKFKDYFVPAKSTS